VVTRVLAMITLPLLYLAPCSEPDAEDRHSQPLSPNMPSLLLVVFTLQFLLHIINTVGASTVNDLVSPASYESNTISILTIHTAMDTV